MATDTFSYYLHFYDATTGEEVIKKEGSSKEAYFGICVYASEMQPPSVQPGKTKLV